MFACNEESVNEHGAVVGEIKHKLFLGSEVEIQGQQEDAKKRLVLKDNEDLGATKYEQQLKGRCDEVQ